MTYDPKITLETIVTIIYCVITAFILGVGYYQLKSIRRTNNAQFLITLYPQFFTEQTLILITILHTNNLIFENNNDIPIFKVDRDNLKRIYPNRNWEVKDYFTTYEIDFLLLNHLDSVGALVENKVIKLDSAYQDFGWYVNVVLSNQAILNYLTWLEDYEKVSFVFEKLRNLHTSFKKFDA